MNEAVGPLATTGVIEAERLASVVRPELPSWIFDDPVVPAVTVPVEGMEAIVKFPVTMTLSIVECTMLPLVAVIVTGEVPGSVKVGVLIVRVEGLVAPNPSVC